MGKVQIAHWRTPLMAIAIPKPSSCITKFYVKIVNIVYIWSMYESNMTELWSIHKYFQDSKLGPLSNLEGSHMSCSSRLLILRLQNITLYITHQFNFACNLKIFMWYFYNNLKSHNVKLPIFKTLNSRDKIRKNICLHRKMEGNYTNNWV